MAKTDMLSLAEGWEVWTDWYEARLYGARISGPPNEAIEIARVQIEEEIWKQGPKVVNAHIKRMLESPEQKLERAIFGFATADADQLVAPPKVPALRRAAIEPIWKGGRLTLPFSLAKLDLSEGQFVAALAALRSELSDLAADVASEANIDKRPAQFLSRLAERIPASVPSHEELFRLGHAETILVGFAKPVTEEWPDFLATRYQSLMLQFDRTMRQSPVWREFRNNAAKETLSAEQVANAELLARETADALTEEEGGEFVDNTISSGLRRLAASLSSLTAENQEVSDRINSGAELLATDLIESVNNILKPIAEAALDSARGYGKNLAKGFKASAKKQGTKDGERAFKWLRRIVVWGAGGAVGAGSFASLSTLLAKYPQAFEWLANVLRYLPKLP